MAIRMIMIIMLFYNRGHRMKASLGEVETLTRATSRNKSDGIVADARPGERLCPDVLDNRRGAKVAELVGRLKHRLAFSNGDFATKQPVRSLNDEQFGR